MTDAPSNDGRRQGKRKRHATRRPRLAANNPPSESAVAMIDRVLLSPVQTRLNGEETKITAVEAIMYQLLRLEQVGDAKAIGALLRYEQLVKSSGAAGVDTVFLDSDYSRSLADPKPAGGTDG